MVKNSVAAEHLLAKATEHLTTGQNDVKDLSRAERAGSGWEYPYKEVG
jgi:hypothetical protein